MSKPDFEQIDLRAHYLAFAALTALLLLTLLPGYVNFGQFAPVAVVGLAILRAAIIVFYFINLRHTGPLVALFAGIGFFWLLVLFLLTLSDFLTRSWTPVLGW